MREPWSATPHGVSSPGSEAVLKVLDGAVGGAEPALELHVRVVVTELNPLSVERELAVTSVTMHHSDTPIARGGVVDYCSPPPGLSVSSSLGGRDPSRSRARLSSGVAGRWTGTADGVAPPPRSASREVWPGRAPNPRSPHVPGFPRLAGPGGCGDAVSNPMSAALCPAKPPGRTCPYPCFVL